MSGRIPEAFIHDLLERTDIVEIIGARVELKRAGREYKARSPFSNEKTPSFFVSPQKQMFFDFSSGKNGTAISFLMEYDRLSFVEAVEELAQRAGLEVPREGGRSDHVVMDGPLDALAGAQRFYRDQLRSAQPAIEYLKNRGVTGDTAKRFGIGFAPESWDALSSFLKDARHAVEAGLLIERDGGGVYDRFRNRIMFPIRDTRGRVIGFGGRTLGNDPAKYLNSPETPLFHKGRNLYGLYEAKQSSKSNLPYLLVVEGYMDVVMLAQHGIPEAVATLGTATTREHLALLFKSTSKVVFCFDGDRAGRSAAWRALEQVLPELNGNRECVFMFLPEGDDPDTLVRQVGAEGFRELVQQAQSLSDFLLGGLAAQVRLGTTEGRAKLEALTQPFVDKIPEGSFRTLLLDRLGWLTRPATRGLGAELARPAERVSSDNRLQLARTPVATAGRPIRRALQVLLNKPELADAIQNLELLSQADVPGIKVLVEAIDFFHAHPGATTARLLESWRDTKKGAAALALLAEDLIRGDNEPEKEFQDIVSMLTHKALRVRVASLLAEGRLRPLTEAETREIDALTRQMANRSPA